MMRRIGFIGNAASSAVGSKDNTGNNVHGHAARDLFAEWQHLSTDMSEENISRLRETYSHLGYIAATMLHTKSAPSYVDGHVRSADFVEKLNLPVVTFGFGCHAMLDDTIADANVDARSVRLLRVIAERAETVGVRGQFTADLCNKYGVKNVSVIGCQSAYVAALLNREKPQLTTRGERPVINVSLGPDEGPLLRLGMAANAGIIGQGDNTEERIVGGDLSKDDFLDDAKTFWLYPYLAKAISEGNPTKESYYNYVKENFHKFYTVRDWRSYTSSNYDFCLGTRFHGNIAAFQAKVPATWVVHDMRLKELCEHLNLPSIQHDQLEKYTDIRQIAEQCSFDDFWKHMPTRTREFVSYLEGNGVADLLTPFAKDGFTKIIAG